MSKNMRKRNLFWAVALMAALAPIASAAIETVEMRVEGMT